jgi:acetyl esterase/lipase
MPTAAKVVIRAEAGLAYEEVGGTKNVHYGPAEKQVMDIYAAALAGSPLVVLIHGGGWVSGDKSGQTAIAKKLNEQGFAVFNINYRWASYPSPEAFPMEVEDTQKATEYAIAHAASYNASTSKVFIVCGSAGGQLGAQAAIQLNEATAELVHGVTMLSGATDLWQLVVEKRGFGNDLAEALGCKEIGAETATPEKEALAKLWSPSRHLVASSKPIAWQLFESAGSELMPKSQYEEMKAAIEALGGSSVTGRLVPGTQHSYAYFSEVETEIYNFIRSH